MHWPREFQPQAILLDISLPDIDGWRVLDRLKHDLALRHIPVYVVSTVDQPERGLKLVRTGMLPKPIQTAECSSDSSTTFASFSIGQCGTCWLSSPMQSPGADRSS